MRTNVKLTRMSCGRVVVAVAVLEVYLIYVTNFDGNYSPSNVEWNEELMQKKLHGG